MRQNEFNFNPVQLRNMVCNASVLAALVSNQICLVKRVAWEWGLATAWEVEWVAIKAYGAGATKAIVHTHWLAYYTAAVDTTKYYQSTVTPHTIATTGTFFIGVGMQDAVTSDYTGGILLAIKDTATASSLDAVSLRITAGWVVLTTTPTALTFDAENLDTAGFHDNVTNNSRITIPTSKAGNYSIDFQWSVTASTSSDFTANVFLYKNGLPLTNILSSVTPYPAGGGGGGNAQIGMSTALPLVVWDYLEVYAQKTWGIMAFLNGTTFRAIKL